MNHQDIDISRIKDGRITEGAYAQDTSLTSIVIPEGVTDIGEIAFYGCTELREVSFPSTLKFIREEAFGESGIEEALLPPGLELIGEKAFFSCESLRRAEVPGTQTVIERDAFGCCDKLHEGYVAPGYPAGIRHHEELQYTLLWCSCPERHDSQTSAHAASFIQKYEDLIMEWIIRQNNIPAMNGLAHADLLRGDTNKYIIRSNAAGTSEITALLMSMKGNFDEGEFDL